MAKRKGFTLIEILIVVAIIGILASVVLVGLGPVQRRGRDARRISDLRQVQTGLELYYNKHGIYPSTSDWPTLQSTLKGDSLGISNVPDDPSSGKHYQYASDGASYVVAANLEDSTNPAFTGSPTGAVLGITCGQPVYCVQL